MSIWAKGGTATKIKIDIGDESAPDYNLTNEWQRFDLTATPASYTHIDIEMPSSSSGDYFYIFGLQLELSASVGPYTPTIGTAQTTPVLLPAGLTTGRDITGVNLFENVRKQSALNLDGSSWAEVHDNESLDFGSGSWTAESWVYWDGISSGDGIISRWYAAERAMLFYTQGTFIRLFTGRTDGTADTDISSGTISVGWRHIVGTYDSSDTKLRIYIDGALDVTSSAFANAYNSNAQSLEIGRLNNNPAGTYTNSIAQPRIYNRALTAEEVQRNYNAGKNIYS